MLRLGSRLVWCRKEFFSGCRNKTKKSGLCFFYFQFICFVFQPFRPLSVPGSPIWITFSVSPNMRRLTHPFAPFFDFRYFATRVQMKTEPVKAECSNYTGAWPTLANESYEVNTYVKWKKKRNHLNFRTTLHSFRQYGKISELQIRSYGCTDSTAECPAQRLCRQV